MNEEVEFQVLVSNSNKQLIVSFEWKKEAREKRSEAGKLIYESIFFYIVSSTDLSTD